MWSSTHSGVTKAASFREVPFAERFRMPSVTATVAQPVTQLRCEVVRLVDRSGGLDLGITVTGRQILAGGEGPAPELRHPVDVGDQGEGTVDGARCRGAVHRRIIERVQGGVDTVQEFSGDAEECVEESRVSGY